MNEQKKDEKLNSDAVAPSEPSKIEEQAHSADSMGSPQAGSGQAELEKLKAERDEYLNGWKRAKADLINYQKDEAKRFQEMAKYGVEMVLEDMITILDSFDLAEKEGTCPVRDRSPQGDRSHSPEARAVSNGMEGLAVIKNQLENILKKRGLERIKVSVGDKFDPSQHESIGEESVPSASSGQAGTIIEVAVAGYTLGGKVVRPAKVKLVK